MSKAHNTSPRAQAKDLIGGAILGKLEEAGLTVVWAADLADLNRGISAMDALVDSLEEREQQRKAS